ncbi:MAG: hypothetical protein QOG68_61, partial [Solirubrobacteraceae bacterium]|nr:hypothetical protein [Solirubrobacteraceae bacterium]
MSSSQGLYVVVPRRKGQTGIVEARLAALDRFYGVAAARSEPEHDDADLAAIVGRLGCHEDAPLVCWGQPFGTAAPNSFDLLVANDLQLRDLTSGWGMAVARHGSSVRLITAPSGPIAGYHAESADFEVWASHAVAAAWLAHGSVAIDAERIPELLGYDFVGGGRSLVAGVSALPPATLCEISAGRAASRCYWSQDERWSPLPADEAQAHGERWLLRTLEQRVQGAPQIALALTGGADSRVLAVALDELGVPASGFTWGEPEWPDVTGASAVAAALGMPWSSGVSWRAEAQTRPAFDAEVRWADGCAEIAPSSRTWPAGAGALVIGAAGEVGRAFYYRGDMNRPAPADPIGIANLLYPEGRLPHATDEAKAAARAAVERWAASALESGRSGWEAMDVLYAEQRVSHWSRTQIPRISADYVGGFMPVEVMRALASLPLAAKLSDGF